MTGGNDPLNRFIGPHFAEYLGDRWLSMTLRKTPGNLRKLIILIVKPAKKMAKNRYEQGIAKKTKSNH